MSVYIYTCIHIYISHTQDMCRSVRVRERRREKVRESQRTYLCAAITTSNTATLKQVVPSKRQLQTEYGIKCREGCRCFPL